MTDLELIERAAKAAGLTVIDLTLTISGKFMVRLPDGRLDHWNPLTDDGDALRLSVKLGLSIDRQDCACCVTVWEKSRFAMYKDEEPVAERFEELSYSEAPNRKIQTEEQATRRAIVRAAAAIGKGMNRG